MNLIINIVAASALLCQACRASGPGQLQVEETEAVLNHAYTNYSDWRREHHFVYKWSLRNIRPPRSVRIKTLLTTPPHLNLLNTDQLRVTVRQPLGRTLSWGLPLMTSDGVIYSDTEKTLCLNDADHDTVNLEDVQITVVVSTMSHNPLQFELKMTEVQQFSVGVNALNQVYNVKPGSPEVRFVALNGAPKDSLLQVKVTSGNDVCALISIQPFTCPVLDTEETVRSRGSYQTISHLAAFNFKRKDAFEESEFPTESFVKQKLLQTEECN